ncbi:hypothetical protein [Ferdinandcohnia sp. SAFN-114]|uniref:hypothetical protein n=1 Tax=Ferdinandcohnia sp. SAFN-114 TaxID=3387275 RepID=UPI003F819BC5
MQLLDTNKKVELKNLILASLMSEGEISYSQNSSESYLVVPFSKEKSYYLSNHIKHHNLKEFIIVEPHKEQMKIAFNSIFEELVAQWYEEGLKIFSKRLDPSFITYQSIIICINLFGSRKLEGISIPTSVDKRFLKNLSYCIEKNLGITVIPGKNQIKIPEVPSLFLENIDRTSTFDSTELANFLTNQEKNKLVQASSK